MLVTFLKKKPTLPKTYLKAFMKSISKNLTFKKPFLQKRKEKENVNEHSQRDNHHSTNLRFTYRFHFQEKQPFLQKRTRKNVFKETIITLPTQDSLTDSLSKRVWESPSPRDPFL